MKSVFKVTALQKTHDPKQDEVVGKFIANNFVDGEYESLVKQADKRYGKDGWDILQIWETKVSLRDVISKKPVRSQRRKKAKA